MGHELTDHRCNETRYKTLCKLISSPLDLLGEKDPSPGLVIEDLTPAPIPTPTPAVEPDVAEKAPAEVVTKYYIKIFL